MRSLRIAFFVGAAVIGVPMTAQVIGSLDRIVPASPTSADVIAALIYTPSNCSYTFSTVVTGSVVRTDAFFYSCGGPSIGPVGAPEYFGPLPAGTYTYQVYWRYDLDPPGSTLGAERTIVVAPAAVPAAAIPTLGTAELLLLALSMSVIALLLLRRMAG